MAALIYPAAAFPKYQRLPGWDRGNKSIPMWWDLLLGAWVVVTTTSMVMTLVAIPCSRLLPMMHPQPAAAVATAAALQRPPPQLLWVAAVDFVVVVDVVSAAAALDNDVYQTPKWTIWNDLVMTGWITSTCPKNTTLPELS